MATAQSNLIATQHMKSLLKSILRRVGYRVIPNNPLANPDTRMIHLLRHHGIDEIFDVGANVGQYANYLRTVLGYRGKIISFEPLSDAYVTLAQRFRRDAKWQGLNIGLGDMDATLTMNVSANSVSSSLLNMKDRHREIAPDSAYERTEGVRVRRLDDVLSELSDAASKKMLKLDVQGYECHVLRGAEKTLGGFRLVQAEISISALYEGEESMASIVEFLQQAGFAPVGFEPALVDMTSGEWLQADVIFANRASGKTASC